ncbi:MAG: S1 RNA-binding domain-containing protein [Armatimonadota bacterium]
MDSETARGSSAGDISGAVMDGIVVKVADYGAIVRLENGKLGLIHISEIADCFVRDVRDYFSEQDRVRVKVLRCNEKGRYELSIKRVTPEELALQAERRPSSGGEAPSLDEMISRFMKESQEKLLDLKRSTEAKRRKRHR